MKVPFRIAHSLSGNCVSLSEKLNCNLNELTLDQLKEIRYILKCEVYQINFHDYFFSIFENSPNFESDVHEVYNFENSVEQYVSMGGTAKSSVQAQIDHFKRKHSS